MKWLVVGMVVGVVGGMVLLYIISKLYCFRDGSDWDEFREAYERKRRRKKIGGKKNGR